MMSASTQRLKETVPSVPILTGNRRQGRRGAVRHAVRHANHHEAGRRASRDVGRNVDDSIRRVANSGVRPSNGFDASRPAARQY